MLKITFCMRRQPQLSREEFQAYYRRKHTRVVGAEDAAKLGMRRYVQLHTLPEEQSRLADNGRGGEPGFDACAEIWLDDYETFERDWLGEEGQSVIRQLLDDEKNFVDWSRSTIFLAEEQVLIDGPVTPARTRSGS